MCCSTCQQFLISLTEGLVLVILLVGQLLEFGFQGLIVELFNMICYSQAQNSESSLCLSDPDPFSRIKNQTLLLL